jgi:acetyl-CoA synthetase
MGMDLILLGDHGQPIEPGESGEVFLIPPSVGLSETLLNQHHDEAYYRACPRGPGGEVLRRHGDRMERWSGGGFRAGGRSDDTMNLSGIKVSSVRLEKVLNDHEAVSESAAVGVQPEGQGAEKLVVFVVPAGSDAETTGLSRDLQRRLSTELNPLFRIHDVVVVNELPRTASGKVIRRRLRDQYGTEA